MDVLETKYVPLVKLQAVKERLVPYGIEENIDSPEKVVNMVRRLLKNADREHLLVISVDAKSKPVCIEVVGIGALSTLYVEPREIFKHSILSNASGIIMVHNHPSGDVMPSLEDFKITGRIRKVADIVGINLLDHIIVGDNDVFYSLKTSVEWKEMEK